jgi:hypothetical protein
MCFSETPDILITTTVLTPFIKVILYTIYIIYRIYKDVFVLIQAMLSKETIEDNTLIFNSNQ